MFSLTRNDILWCGAALLALSTLQVSQSLLWLGLGSPIGLPLTAMALSVGAIAWALGLLDQDDWFGW